MNTDFEYTIKRIRFDENYQPSANKRITTNFANLARGERRRENLRNALRMVYSRFNALANRDNPKGERYAVELELISVDIDIECNGQHFQSIEMLKTYIFDKTTTQHTDGIIGTHFSSQIRATELIIVLLD